jgi:hypothetical protein
MTNRARSNDPAPTPSQPTKSPAEASPAARYFRFDWTPTNLEAGSIWTEFVGEQPTRQVERYGCRWFSSRDEYHAELGPSLAEGPLHQMDYSPEHEVSAEEFERAWSESGRYRSRRD